MLEEAKEVVERSPTPLRMKHNKRIFAKFLDICKKYASGKLDEEAFHEALVSDFELFCVAYVRLDNWLPMFTAPWQSRVFDIIAEHDENLFILCRKVGKTAFLTAYMLWRCISARGRRFVFVAPTEKQLFGYMDALKALDKMPFLSEYYVKVREGGRKSAEGLVFAKSWSEVEPLCLAQKQRAATKRGVKGSDMVIDEIQNVLKIVMETVLDDVMADAYTEKKMSKFGTPIEVVNPDLEPEWEEAQKDSETGTYHMDIWQGLEEGCISKKYVKSRFRKLRIPCPWGKFEGICGKRDGKGPFKSKRDGGRWMNWECDECCELNPTFVAENLGKFPRYSEKFFPKPQLEASAPEAYDITVPNPVEGRQYVMGIDYGAGINPTQITVWEIAGNRLILNHWDEIRPIRAVEREGHRSYDPIIREIQSIYTLYGRGNKNRVKRVYADATTIGQQVTNDLRKGENGIPKSKIYCNQTGEGQKNWLGVWMSGMYRSQAYHNYRRLLLDGRVMITQQQPFYNKFMNEHVNVVVRNAQSGNYQLFQEPQGGSIDLVDSCVLAALEFSDEVKGDEVFLGYVHYPRDVSEDERQRSHRPARAQSDGFPVVVLR